MKKIVLILIGLSFGAFCWSETIEEVTPPLAEKLAKQLMAKEKVKVAALDFTDLRGRPNELGRFLAENLSIELVIADGITVVDRANINAIMAEHKLTAEGLVKPENAKKLGEFAGVDAILTGTLAEMDNKVTLTVKAISMETAEIVAAGRMRFSLTEDMQRMMGVSIANSGSSTAVNGSSRSSEQVSAIAEKEIGQLTVILKDVVTWSDNKSGTPNIRCVIEIYNRDINNPYGIAINGDLGSRNSGYNFSSPGIWDYDSLIFQNPRTSLIGLGGTNWNGNFSKQHGISLVGGFEDNGKGRGYNTVTQKNPSSIARYISKGNYYEFNEPPERGLNWMGKFRTIAPGKKITASLVFSPPSDDRNRNSRQAKVTVPKVFQISMELVFGAMEAGGDAVAPKKPILELISFDRISIESPKK